MLLTNYFSSILNYDAIILDTHHKHVKICQFWPTNQRQVQFFQATYIFVVDWYIMHVDGKHGYNLRFPKDAHTSRCRLHTLQPFK